MSVSFYLIVREVVPGAEEMFELCIYTRKEYPQGGLQINLEVHVV